MKLTGNDFYLIGKYLRNGLKRNRLFGDRDLVEEGMIVEENEAIERLLLKLDGDIAEIKKTDSPAS